MKTSKNVTGKSDKAIAKQNNVTNYLLCVLAGLLLGFAIIAGSIQSTRHSTVIPDRSQGIIYALDGHQAIIKLDLRDPNAVLLLQDIERVCNGYKIPSCRSVFSHGEQAYSPMQSQVRQQSGTEAACSVK